MITVAISQKSLHAQRRGLEILLTTMPDRREFILGALEVLDWVEFGKPSPLGRLAPTIQVAIDQDRDG